MRMNRKEALAGGEAFEAVERSSLSRQAYNQLRKALMVGELQPGQKLSGREIALRLGTSLTPVREALLQLVAEGVLELRTGHSVTVPLPTRAVYTELRDIRVQTEGLGAERAAALITGNGQARR
jgi:GntR family colanic acid and biofilm gene transcriptional regulator